MATEDAVSASAKGATFLILLQIGSRALTFALNQVLLRFLSPELLGAAVQLELFIISAHHFARESLRVACQRQPDGGIQAIVNLSYLSIGIGFPIVLLLAQWYLTTTFPDVPYFVDGLRLCELAAIVELFSEPAFVAVQQEMLYKTRAAAEATAVVLKTISTAAMVFWARHQWKDLGVLPFAVGELVFCMTLTVIYLWQTASVATKQGFSLLPRIIKPSPPTGSFLFSVFSKSLVYLSVSLYVQSGIKYVLTQGDSIVSTTLATLEDQGKYALSANYGGLIARMIFRPIEDSCRNLFAKLCGQAPDSTQKEDKRKAGKAPPTQNIQRAATTLRDILRFYNIVSLIVFAVGPTAAPLLLRLVAGSRWSDSGAGDTLGTYCYSIPLLAVNGVSEAFVAATASTRELQRQSLWMAAFSVGFAVSAYVFLRVMQLGAQGLVLANCVNMLLRIIFNLHFVTGFFVRQGQEFPLIDILPNRYAVGATAVAVSALPRTSGLLQQYGLFGDIVRVAGVGGTLAVAIAISERSFLLECFRRLRSSGSRT